MGKSRLFIGLVFMIMVVSGCAAEVLKQTIPVSTNPMGAKIYVNGKMTGQTPGTVSLERNQDHVLTLVKENYRQADVVIRKQYQSGKVFMKAVQAGVDSGLFFKDARMGIGSGYNTYTRQEETGEAYILVPPTVTVTLMPLAGFAKGESPPPAPDAGHPPADTGLTAKDVVQAGVVAGAAVGATQMKPIEKKWETSSSTKSYTKPDGTRVTEKSSTSVGVGVNPAGVVEMLDVLFK